MKKLIIANWKMNMTSSSIEDWFDVFNKHLDRIDSTKVTVGIAPSYPYLEKVKKLSDEVLVVGQDASFFEDGAHTSQVSARQLRDYCTYSMIGHSETRPKYEEVFSKAFNCMKEELIPIVCISDFSSLTGFPNHMFNSVIALEDAQDISQEGKYKKLETISIQERVNNFTQKFGIDFSGIIYGGSVNRQNAAELGMIVGLDGLLVGNASLDADHFIEIVCGFTQI